MKTTSILRRVFATWALFVGPTDAHDLTTPMADSNLVFLELDGIVAAEAEHFVSQQKTDVRAWYRVAEHQLPGVKPDPDGPHLLGSSGACYLEALPDSRATHDDTIKIDESFFPEPGTAGVLTYRVHITTPGRYYVWVRHLSTGSEDNGLHVGLDGQWPESGQRWQTIKKRKWAWESRQRTEKVHTGIRFKLYLDIAEAGEHQVHFSIREDGFEFDKFVLASDRDYIPEGLGPKPVVKAGTVPAPKKLSSNYTEAPIPPAVSKIQDATKVGYKFKASDSSDGARAMTKPIAEPGLVFEEVDGVAAVEAEHFLSQEKHDIRAWFRVEETQLHAVKPDLDTPHLLGASGASYLEALPDSRWSHGQTLVYNEQQTYLEAWHVLWKRYQDEAFVYGYDLVNEPRKLSMDISYDDLSKNHLIPLYRKLIDEHNAINDTKMCLCQSIFQNKGDKTNENQYTEMKTPIGRKNVVFAPHIYQANTEWIKPTLERFDRESELLEAPIFIGEWGFPTFDTTDVTLTGRLGQLTYKDFYIHTAEEFDRMGVGSIKAWFLGSRTKQNFLPGGPSTWAIFSDEKSVGTVERKYTTDIIARPYPQAMAGDIHSFMFDHATRSLDIQFTSDNSQGASRIFIGANRHYPDGFSVTCNNDFTLCHNPLKSVGLEVCKAAQHSNPSDFIWDPARQQLIVLKWPLDKTEMHVRVVPGIND